MARSLFHGLKKRGLFKVKVNVNTDALFEAYPSSKVMDCLHITHIAYKKPLNLSVSRLSMSSPREVKRRPLSARPSTARAAARTGRSTSTSEKPLSRTLQPSDTGITPTSELLDLAEDTPQQRKRRLSLSVASYYNRRNSQLIIPKIKVKVRNKFYS